MEDEIWEWASILSKKVQEATARKRENRRIKRNENARRRYAINKLLPKKPKEQEPELLDYDPPESCYCAVTSPPCSWCTSPEREFD